MKTREQLKTNGLLVKCLFMEQAEQSITPEERIQQCRF